jgi:23S rRNA pseudouridine1911/1915/1917 synthase
MQPSEPTLIKPGSIITLHVTDQTDGFRLDALLTLEVATYSRTFFKRLIEQGHVTINSQQVCKSSRPVKPGDIVTVTFPLPPQKDIDKLATQNLGVGIIADHEHFMIIDKPAGLLVHAPTSHNTEVTLSDWLVARFADLEYGGYSDRPGIVHRLDRNTSGLMIVPKNIWAHQQFSDMFKNRTIHKTYHAVVRKHPDRAGTIDYKITRHPGHGNRMIHSTTEGRDSITSYKVLEYLHSSTLVEAKPVTGRTHQIRVHFNAINHPLIGDPVYGSKSKVIKRHALHAHTISFEFMGTTYEFSCEYPADFVKLIETARTQDV